MGARLRGLGSLAALAMLAACGRIIPEGGRPPGMIPAPAPAPASALIAGVAPGKGMGALNLSRYDAGDALASFTESCPRLTARDDTSGLTRKEDWRPACQAAATWNRDDAARFFATYFETAVVGDGAAFATGYYEPEIAGVRARQPGYDVPVYALPPDLTRGWYDDMPVAERSGQPPLGRYDAQGRFVPYFERAEIEQGALEGKGLEIAWAADPVEFFFLQIQGSGRLRGPDGTVLRIGYAGQNGREYAGIGSLMRQRGLIGSEPGQYSGSMQGIMQYLREHPEEGRALMRENKSWVFFRELTGDGPLGALNVPVRPQSSVAADPKFVPLGAPVFLDVDNPLASGLWIAQDTGGAIKGANRFDTFWGAGEEAQEVAGGMSTRGQAVLLLPKGTLRRLGAE
ncbi:murein transglycosylase A [Altererythrobacter sp. CC-YST694]|uniref:murein transglycosylase A n=1 Tax=Altererythrobacter sp. CC-YST694 TaxID=2755038 RepID=UPI001D028E4C|nr:murein transglycosylase A [Altererythrobacter sp. CC-YST694]MCB5425777.1 murein transglycosylase A [Altererythrobacter sp. CC-YST694]